MENVLTILINPEGGVLDHTLISTVRAGLESLSAEIKDVDWLSEGDAVDIMFVGADLPAARKVVQSALLGEPIDVIAQRNDRRRKHLLVADMDSTIVTGETLDELANFAGIKDQIAAITKRAMQGDISFDEALKTRIALLEGLDEGYLAQAMNGVTLTSGAETLVRTMRANGAFTALISGGFSYFTDRVRSKVGFHSSLGNQLEIIQGKLTGKVIPPIVNQDIKKEMLLDMAAQQSLSLSQTMTIGDGANDVPMLKAAGTGIAFHAHPIARTATWARLDHTDLTSALFIQGYHRDEFVSS